MTKATKRHFNGSVTLYMATVLYSTASLYITALCSNDTNYSIFDNLKSSLLERSIGSIDSNIKFNSHCFSNLKFTGNYTILRG